jgi:hypothetical protein
LKIHRGGALILKIIDNHPFHAMRWEMPPNLNAA